MKPVRLVSAVAISVTAGTFGWAALGQGAGIPESRTIDLSDSADVRLEGAEKLSETGWTVAAAGDMNGDGRADYVVGGRLADPKGRRNAGAAWVVFGTGKPAKKIALGSLGGAGISILGAAAGDHAGMALSPAGDVNGDGLADLIVGAAGFDRPESMPVADDDTGVEQASPKGAGAAYVVFGRRGGGEVDLAGLGAGGIRLVGAAGRDEAGASVSSIRDLSGDGVPELVVGAPRHGSEDHPEAGAVYVVFGSKEPGDVDLGAIGADAGWRIDGPQNGLAGVSVTGTEDMNGDGVPEVALGAPRAEPGAQGSPGSEQLGGLGGAAYVVFGRKSGNVDLAALGADGFAVSGDRGDLAGVSIGRLGDVNGDGRDDFGVGAPLADHNQRKDSGSAYVVFGRAGTETVDLSKLGDWGWRIDGVGDEDQTGASIGGAGDFDRDGRGDVLVGAAFASPLSRERAGAAYLVAPQAPGTALDLGSSGDQVVRLAGAAANDGSRSTAAVGDVNGDGGADVLMGANRSRNEDKDAVGAAWLVFGAPPAPPPPVDPGAAEEVAIDRCVAARNVQAVVDDSGSMADTDTELLRKRAMEVILAKPRNEGELFGATEFGSNSDQLFEPGPIPVAGSKRYDALLELLDRRIQANNGGTDYNLAFGSLADANPAAQARIFMTDGEHNAGEYLDLHRGGPPTFVIGLQIGKTGESGERLQRIATETGGRYYPNAKAATLVPIPNSIDSRLNCDVDNDHFVDTQVEDEDTESHQADIDEDAYSADLTVSWDNPDDDFDLEQVNLVDGAERTVVPSRVLARALQLTARRGPASRKLVRFRGLRLRATRGDSYIALRIAGVHGADRMAWRMRARKVKGKARLSSHVSLSRRRR